MWTGIWFMACKEKHVANLLLIKAFFLIYSRSIVGNLTKWQDTNSEGEMVIVKRVKLQSLTKLSKSWSDLDWLTISMNRKGKHAMSS